jgi:PadR family transcriptional regulator PadR
MTRLTRSPKPLTPVDLQILLTLASGSLHGYGIKLEIARRTGGEMSLGSGTLYEAVQRLEERGLIATAPAPDGAEADPRRRYYRLEAAGERILREELERLAAVVRYGRALELLFESWEG